MSELEDMEMMWDCMEELVTPRDDQTNASRCSHGAMSPWPVMVGSDEGRTDPHRTSSRCLLSNQVGSNLGCEPVGLGGRGTLNS